MTTASAPSIFPSIRRYTAEDFLALPDHRGFELVDGFPETRTAHVHRLAGQPSDLQGQDEFDGEDVLPGFRMRLDQLFQPLPE